MIEKHGKYYADWRDEHGQRHRRAFTTEKAAANYTQAMVELREKRLGRKKRQPRPTNPRRRPSRRR